MEVCETTLTNYLNERQYKDFTKETFEERMQMGYQIIRGMYVLHDSYKLVHRNLSLNSIQISADGFLKIGDLGWVSESGEVFEEHSNINRRFERHTSFQQIPIKALLKTKTESKNIIESEVTYKQLFAPPEQSYKCMNSQKADIFSLGLILIALLYPTENEKARIELINKCKLDQPPNDFIKKHKELARLIRQMLSIQTSRRPSAKEILFHSLFRYYENKTKKDPNEIMVSEECDEALKTEFKIMFEKTNKWKTRYLLIDGKKLFIYKKKDSIKAKLCYPLLECAINTKEICNDNRMVSLPKRSLSTILLRDIGKTQFKEGTIQVIIRHLEIVTITLALTKDAKHSNWLNYLRNG